MHAFFRSATPLRPVSILLAAALLIAPASWADKDKEREDRESATRARGAAYAYLMRSMFAARQGEFRSAAAEVRKAIRAQPDQPDVYIQGAAMLRAMGRHDEAWQLAVQGLELAPTNVETLRFVADHAADSALASNADSQRIQEALDLYDRLAAEEPLDATGLRKVANLRMLLGDLDGAIAAGRELAEQRPGDADVTQMLYRLLVHARQEPEALQVLLRYIGRHPFERAMVDNADRLATKLDAWDIVADELGQHEATRTGQNPAQGLRGQALIRLGRMEEAAEALENALAADSYDVRTRLRLVWAYRNLRRLADASLIARGLAEEKPGDWTMQLVLAQILDQQRSVGEAMTSYEDALLLLTTDTESGGPQDRDMIRRQLAQLHLQRDQLGAARRVFGDLEHNANAESYELEAELAIAEENWDVARQAARLLRETGRSGSAARLEGEVLARQGKFGKAEPLFAEAVRELGPYYRYGVALLYIELDRADEAEAWVRGWVDRQPNEADAHFDLGRLLYSLERLDEAETYLRKAFELDPAHSAALNFLGYSMAERGDRLDEAKALIERALVIDSHDGAYLDSLGWVYFQMGQFDEAREPLERAAREYPSDPIILDHLGDLYSGLGEMELARAAWSRALESTPADPEAIRTKIAHAEAPSEE